MTPEPKLTKPQPTPEEMEAEYSAIEAAFRVIARVLAIRFFLFLSLVGSFTLAIIATNNQTPVSLYIMALYALVTTFPLTALEWKGRNGG